MPGWSQVTASGSATTWSLSTAGGSNTTWADNAGSRYSFGWIPYSRVTDLWIGVDFIPRADIEAPAKVSINRPLQIWNLSTVTASNFTTERRP